MGEMNAFVSVTLERRKEDVLEVFEKTVKQKPEVMSGFLMIGGADYLLHVVVRDLDHYQRLISELTRTPGVCPYPVEFCA